MIDAKVLELFEKSRILQLSRGDFNTNVSVNSMYEYSFSLPSCFLKSRADRDIDEEYLYFERRIVSFINRYLQCWLEQIQSNKDEAIKWNWIEYFNVQAEYFYKFSLKEQYKNLSVRNRTIDIHVSPNQSVLRMCRFGDILVFNVTKEESSYTKHVSGTKAVLSLCRAHDPNSNQGVYELIHNIQTSFSLPKKITGNRHDNNIDFNYIGCLLSSAAPYVDWNFIPSNIIKSYVEDIEEGIIVGKYFDLPIYAKIVHVGQNSSNPTSDKIWRRGNVTNVSDSIYQFKVLDNLQLTITIQSSLPYIYCGGDYEGTQKTHREQFILLKAGTILATQLCSMIQNLCMINSIANGN